RPRRLSTLVACVAIAASGAYYVFMTSVLVVATALINVLGPRRRAHFGDVSLVLGIIVGLFFLEYLPHLWHSIIYGRNPFAVVRDAEESISNALVIDHLLRPIPFHAFRELKHGLLGGRMSPVPTLGEYYQLHGTEADFSHLGAIGAC